MFPRSVTCGKASLRHAMPIDLASVDRRIIVADRSGAQLPYSRGIMATSLLATGVATEEAYRLASLVQDFLVGSGQTALDAERLLSIVAAILKQDAPTGTSERWLAWRRAKRSGRPIVIVFCGAPGVGKSTIATRMAVRFGVTSVITSDAIRDVLRTVVPVGVLPELHRSTFELIEADSPLPFLGFERQANAVAAATAAVAQRLASERRSAVLEGVHLLPGAISKAIAKHPARPIVVERLIVERDEAGHRAKLLRRAEAQPLRAGERHLSELQAIRSIQNYLVRCANLNDIAAINTDDAGLATHDVVDEIVQRIGDAAP